MGVAAQDGASVPEVSLAQVSSGDAAAAAPIERDRLEGRPGDPEAVRRVIQAGGEVTRFYDPARPYLHPEDVAIALDIDRYDFAERVDFEDGRTKRVARPAAIKGGGLPTLASKARDRTVLLLEKRYCGGFAKF